MMKNSNTIDSLARENINKKFGIVSLGCPKNLVDTEVTIGLLENAGYILTQQLDEARIILVNTCSFIDKSRKESTETILEMAELKKNGACEKLLVLGCFAQLYKGSITKEIPEIDAVIGSADYPKVVEILNELDQGEKVESVHKPLYVYDHQVPRHLCTLPHTAYVKISEGCDHVCSFCIIPRLRGKQRSRPIESILQEVQQLGDNGVREINLIAQDLTDYGKDIYGKHRLVDLLNELNKVDSIRWIRLLYTYPSLVTDELIDSIGYLEKICKYIDMPLQHINDTILDSMRRNTSGKHIRNLIYKLRSRVPGIVIRTTFIVGYPGETEEQFNELVDFVKESQFERLGVFTYSFEEHTLSHRLKNQIPQKVKQQRLNSLMQTQQKIIFAKQSELIGRNIDVLIDRKMQNGKLKIVGRTSQQAPDIDGVTYIKSKQHHSILPGSLIQACVLSTMGYDLEAEAFL